MAHTDPALADDIGRLQRMFDGLPDLHVFVVPVWNDGEIIDFEFRFANRAACRALGVPHDELVGSRLIERFAAAVPPQAIRAVVDVVVQSKEAVWDEVPIDRHRDGAPMHYDVRIIPVDGGAHLVWRDVSDRVAARRRIEASEARYRLLVGNIDDVVALCSSDGAVLEMSSSVSRLLGWDPEELRSRFCSDLVLAEDLAGLNRAKHSAADGVKSRAYVRMLTVDGDHRWVRCTITPIDNRDATPDASFVIVVQDAEDEVRARAALAAADERLRLAMEASDSPIALLDNTGNIRTVNAALCELVRGEADHLCTLHWTDFTVGDDKDQDSVDIVEIRRGNLERSRTRRRIVRLDGTMLWVDVSISIAHDVDGAVRHFVVTIVPSPETPVIDGYQSSMLANVPDAVISVGASGVVQRASARCSDLSSLVAADWAGRRLEDVGMPTALLAVVDEAVDAAQRNAYTVVIETDAALDGDLHHFHCSATPIRPPEVPEPVVIVTIRDVTAERAERALLEERSNRDMLTDLPNSVALEEELLRALATVGRIGGRVTVLLYDIDQFRRIGEVHGPLVSDAVVVEFAQRIRRAARPSDLVARLERDRFAIVLRDNRTSEEAEIIARRIVAATESPIAVRGLQLAVSCSVGIAQSLPESNAVSLVGAASAAAARAKRLHSLVAFAPGSEPATGAASGGATTTLAMPGDDLDAWYQPIVDLASLAPVGYEALMRWRRPDGSVPDSADFLAEAVADGRIHDLGAWLLRVVAEQQVECQRHDEGIQYLSLNVSHAELAQPGYLMFLRAVVDRAGGDANRLRVEIDEATLLSTSEIVRRNLVGLREMGVGIVVDRFGADAGALSSLRRTAVTAVKLDHRITTALLHGDHPEYEMRVVELARSLGIEVIATHVGSLADANALRTVGCSHVQGAAFGRPQPASAVWNQPATTH